MVGSRFIVAGGSARGCGSQLLDEFLVSPTEVALRLVFWELVRRCCDGGDLDLPCLL